jgi:peptidoglycan/LPS O-acetylase OafA/YrhL
MREAGGEDLSRKDVDAPRTGGQIDELQSLRGIAALVVMIGHCLAYFQRPYWVDRLLEVLNGHGCVVIFFVLSGFVLARSLRRAALDRGDIASFYVRRLFRIYPALWAASLLSLAYVMLLHWQVPVEDSSAWFQERFKREYFTPLGIAASFAGALGFLIPPVWSILVELVYSAAMPFVVLVARRGTIALFTLTIVALIVSIRFGQPSYYGVAAYGIDFILGAWLAFLTAGVAKHWASSALRIPIASASIVVLLSCRVIWSATMHDAFVHLIELAAAWALVGSIAVGAFRPSLLRSAPLVQLGKISYSLYLLHFPIMCISAKVIYGLNRGGSPVASGMMLLAVTGAVSLVASYGQYRWVELPGIRLGRRMVPLIDRRRAAG